MRVNVVSPWYPDAVRPYAGVFVANQVEALRSRGHHLFVEVPSLFPAPAGPIPSRVESAMEHLARKEPGAIFHEVADTCYIPSVVPSGSSQLVRAASFASSLALKRKTLPRSWDVVHAHLAVPTGLACLDLGDSPLVITEHQSQLATLLADPAVLAAYAETVARSNAFLTVSNVVKELIVDAVGVWAHERIQVVPNVVDLNRVPFSARTSKQFSKWLYVGGLFIHKGVRDLLKAFVYYRLRVDSNASLTLVGDGPLRTWIHRFARRHEIDDAIDLVGPVRHADIGWYLASADIFVHLSAYETFGIATLEAIAAGLPVISRRNGGAEEAWGDLESQCGVFVSKRSKPAEVADAIGILGHRSLDLENAKDEIQRRFSPAVVAAQLEEIYERCLK